MVWIRLAFWPPPFDVSGAGPLPSPVMATDPLQPIPGLEDIQPHVFSNVGSKQVMAPAGAPAAGGPVTAAGGAAKFSFDPGTDTIAIISDIHANLEALTAVLADIDGRGVKRIIC